MRTRAAFVFALLAAGAAHAQAPVADDAPTPVSGQAAPTAAAPTPQASGGAAQATPPVVVTGRNRACGKRDQACIDKVSDEIWRRYPEQIATLCQTERTRRISQGYAAIALGQDSYAVDMRLTPQTQKLCDYGAAHGLAAK